MPRSNRYIEDDQLALNSVVTLATACRRWGKARNTVLMAINKGYITAEKQGSVWMISVASLIRHWQAPRH